MFSWLKRYKLSSRSVHVSNALYFAYREVYYNSGDTVDEVRVIQPLLYRLNAVMDVDPEKRLSTIIQYDLWLMAISRHDTNGTLGTIVEKATKNRDKVILALIDAALYEIYMKELHGKPSKKNRLDEISTGAQSLLSLLNKHSSANYVR